MDEYGYVYYGTRRQYEHTVSFLKRDIDFIGFVSVFQSCLSTTLGVHNLTVMRPVVLS